MQPSQRSEELAYTFVGKVLLGPAGAALALLGATLLTLRGNQLLALYFSSNKAFLAMTGVTLAVAGLSLVTATVFWLVLRVEFEVTDRAVVVTKRGLLRSSAGGVSCVFVGS